MDQDPDMDEAIRYEAKNLFELGHHENYIH